MAYPELKVNVDSELARYKEYAEIIRPMVIDTVTYLNRAIKQGKRIIAEGAQSTMLSIDFGLYPNVTSSSSSIGGVCTGLGIPPQLLKTVVGIVRAYAIRVGTGHLPTWLNDEIGEYLQTVGNEVGVTTGRKRRCGWMDLFAVNYTHAINGYTVLALTKLDILDGLKELKIGIGYSLNGVKLEDYPATEEEMQRVVVEYATLPGWYPEKTTACKTWNELPKNAKAYVEFVENFVGVPVRWIGVGQGREAIIDRGTQH